MENENQFNNSQQNPAAGNPQPTNVDFGADIQRFFAEDLKDMFVATVVRPMNGVRRWLEETRSKSIVNPLCTIVLSFLITTLIPFVFFQIKVKGLFSFGDCIQMFGLLPVFYGLFFTIFMFIFLAIKQKPDILFAFRNAAIHVFILTLAILVFCIVILIFGLEAFAVSIISMNFGSLLTLLIIVYAFSLGISGVRQVLYSCSNKEGEDNSSWYIAPLIIVLSYWLTQLVISSMQPSLF